MELTEKDILKKTHYGLNIYSFILRQYYKDEIVIALSGRKCKPAKNPFRNDSLTLQIEEIDNQFLFQDSEDENFKGNPFDFAAMYFNSSGQDLLQILNKKLHLHIGENQWYNDQPKFEMAPQMPKPKIVSPKFSYFKAPVTNTWPEKEVTIPDVYHIIKQEHKEPTEQLRSIEDKKKARRFKATNFDYVTFSGLFNKRSDQALKKHSGLLVLDFDHIPDPPGLKRKLLEDDYFETELLFTSPSGDGLKWVVPIDITEYSHQEWFRAISNYILETYELQVDHAGKDVSRACFVPHDNSIYLNPKYHNA